MRTILLHFTLLFTIVAIAQHERGTDIIISEHQKDDIYLAGENIDINAVVNGDMVLAGSKITIRDTIYQDLIVAGGEVIVKGYVADDIRAAGGKLTIDSEIGDDVIVAGGEVFITKNAVIHGNLINFSGDIQMNGEVMGTVKSYSGKLIINGTINKEAKLFGEEILINGEIKGTSKLAASSIIIGENAKFHKNVQYWSEDSTVDFKNSLIDATANFDETLMSDREEFSWKGFGIAALGFWLFYLFSAFLVIVLLNWAFGNFFSTAATYLDKTFLKSVGYGAIYLIGVPFLVLAFIVIIIGIPIGLFLGIFYVFSLLFGHLITALLIAHYLGEKADKQWNFWSLVILALGIASVIRLLTFIPFLGTLLSFVVIAIAYGLIIYTLLQKKAALMFEN
ncbi:MAG: polymer-forming cytoskeletal protein [Maribacter arcticus]|uniref:polymer-forming cytoskeletal protein n=1 Tax=Maribacter arcticus TaxID=561365 RepID=UPI00300204E6